MWQFYIIKTLGNIKEPLSIIALICGIILSIITLLIILLLKDYEYESEEVSRFKKKYLKIL